jgi:hypothetical protein
MTLRKLLSSLLILAIIVPAYSHAQEDDEKPAQEKNRGTGGAEFSLLSVDIRHKCAISILYGAADSRYRGTAYIVPKPLIGLDSNNNMIFDVIPNAPADADIERKMSVGVYFQVGNEGSARRQGVEGVTQQKTCNIDNVINEHNANKPAEEIKTRSRLMITKIAASIPILGDKAVDVIGSDSTGMIDYYGEDLIFYFDLKNKEDYELIRNHARSGNGIPLRLEIFFAATASDGGVELKVDLSSAITEVEAKANAKGMVKRGDVALAISNAVHKSAITANVMASTNPEFNTKMMTIIESIITSVDSAIAQTKVDDQADRERLATKNENDATRAHEREGREAEERNNNRQDRGDSGEQGGNLVSNAEALVPAIEAKAAIRRANTKENRDLKISFSTTTQVHSFVATSKIMAKMNQPGLAEPELKAGEKKKFFARSIKAGQMFELNLNSAWYEEFRYKLEPRWLRKQEILGLGLDEYYKELKEIASRTIGEEEEKGKYPRAWVWAQGDGFKLGKLSFWKYMYGQNFLVQTSMMRKMFVDNSTEVAVPLTRNLLADRELPFSKTRLTFTATGLRSFTLAEVIDQPADIKKRALWNATLDDQGIIHFKALKDLGEVSLVNGDKPVSAPMKVASFFRQPVNYAKFYNTQDRENPAYLWEQGIEIEERPIRRSVLKLNILAISPEFAKEMPDQFSIDMEKAGGGKVDLGIGQSRSIIGGG